MTYTHLFDYLVDKNNKLYLNDFWFDKTRNKIHE